MKGRTHAELSVVMCPQYQDKLHGRFSWMYNVSCHARTHDQRCMRTNVHIAIDAYTYVLVLLLSPQLQLEMNVLYGTLAIA